MTKKAQATEMKKILQFQGRREVVSIDKLIPYEFNNKDHPESQLNLLVQMFEMNYTDEVLVDENYVIIAGHGRLEAAKKAGYDGVEVKVREGQDITKTRAFRLMHNKVAEIATPNRENINIELDDIGEQVIGDYELNYRFSEYNNDTFDPNAYANGNEGEKKEGSGYFVTVEFESLEKAEEYIEELKGRGMVGKLKE